MGQAAAAGISNLFPIHYYLFLSKIRMRFQGKVKSEEGKSKIPNAFAFGILVEEGGFEPPKQTQQIYSLSPLATRELLHMKLWSWWTDLNPRPADYKSAALPAELHQHGINDDA